MRKCFFLLVMMLLSCATFGQSKLDLQLLQIAKKAAEAKARNEAAASNLVVKVTAILADGASVPTEKLAELGVKVVSVSG